MQPSIGFLRRGALVAVLGGFTLLGCRTGRNYPDVAGPRSAGVGGIDASADRRGDTLRIVSFNIAFGREVDRALELLLTEPGLRNADVILLQEMDAESTSRIATRLRMWHVYYPAIHHLRAKRDFGNAILSAWPIVEDAKLILPHRSRYAGTQRTATAATIRVRDSLLVRVYSTHLSTILDLGSGGRRDQLAFILDDAARFDRVIIGGDMNMSSFGSLTLNQLRGPLVT